MPRDYAPKPRRQNKKGAPGWAWLALGLAVGLFVALLVYLMDLSPDPEAPKLASVTPASPAPAGNEARGVRKAPPPAAPEPARPRFDFYTILPDLEIPVPDLELPIPEQEVTGPEREGMPQVEAPGTYMLQAGAFRRYEEADRLKASLALLGLEAHIQTVEAANREKWHRVRIGPFTDLERLNTVRSRLKEHEIDALLLKIST